VIALPRLAIEPLERLAIAPAALVADVLARFGRARLRALGGSMIPTLHSGDVVTVAACAAGQLQRGDIVLMRDGDRLYAHRLLARAVVDGSPCLVTRGDAHWRRDPPRPLADLLGRVTDVTRHDRTIAAPFDASLLDRVHGLVSHERTRLRRSLGRFLQKSSR
jgi:signal peptidase I